MEDVFLRIADEESHRQNRTVQDEQMLRASTAPSSSPPATAEMIVGIHPLISASIVPLAERDSKAMEYFPFFWFLGVYVLPNGKFFTMSGLTGVSRILDLNTLSYTPAAGVSPVVNGSATMFRPVFLPG